MTYTHAQIVKLFALCREFNAVPIIEDGGERFNLQTGTETEIAEAFRRRYHAIIGPHFSVPKIIYHDGRDQ